MSKNTQIETLARVIALAIADGDMKRADEIVAWASSGKSEKVERKPRDKTATFVRKYLSPNAPYDKEKIERFINQNIVKEPTGVDLQVVKNNIVNMPYADFLKTIYWRGVSLFVKRRGGWKCAKCGSAEKVEVHHKTYDHHGDEIHHLEDLTALCDKCHKGEHTPVRPEKEEKAQAQTPEIQVRTRRRPKTGSALSLSEIVSEKSEIQREFDEINNSWSSLVIKYSCFPRLAKALAKSSIYIKHGEGGKLIVGFQLANDAQVQWVNEKYIRDMERYLRETVGRKDIELRAELL